MSNKKRNIHKIPSYNEMSIKIIRSLRGERVLKECGYFKFPFLMPNPNVWREINYCTWRCRTQFEQQVSLVSFKAVDVKEIEE